MSSSKCCFLTCILVSQEAGKVVWYSHLLKNFSQFVVIHIVKGFRVVNEAETVFCFCFYFSGITCSFHDPADVGNLIFGFSASSKPSLNIWKLLVLIWLKASVKNFEHFFASVWGECNCAVVWTFFGIAFLWDWNENWNFPFLWPLPTFPYFAGLFSTML